MADGRRVVSAALLPRVDRWHRRCGAGGPSPPPACLLSPRRRCRVRSPLLLRRCSSGGVDGPRCDAAAGVCRLIPPPPIHSSPTMALNVNECGSVSSHIYYQLFTHPPPLLSFVQICHPASKLASASASDHPP